MTIQNTKSESGPTIAILREASLPLTQVRLVSCQVLVPSSDVLIIRRAADYVFRNLLDPNLKAFIIHRFVKSEERGPQATRNSLPGSV